MGDLDLLIVLRSLTAVKVPTFPGPNTIVEGFQYSPLIYDMR